MSEHPQNFAAPSEREAANMSRINSFVGVAKGREAFGLGWRKPRTRNFAARKEREATKLWENSKLRGYAKGREVLPSRVRWRGMEDSYLSKRGINPITIYLTIQKKGFILINALTSVRALIERGWCSNAPALDENGRFVWAENPKAISWSLDGAIIAAVPEDERVAIFQAVLEALPEKGRPAHCRDLSLWNDSGKRNKHEVLVAIDAAITAYQSRQR